MPLIAPSEIVEPLLLFSWTRVRWESRAGFSRRRGQHDDRQRRGPTGFEGPPSSVSTARPRALATGRCSNIPVLDILLVGKFDQEASPLGAKWLGELTAVC